MMVDKYIKILLVVLTVSFGSCVKEDLTTGDRIVEGEQTTLKLQLTTPQMNIVTRGGLTSAEEEDIKSLAVYIFDENGFILSSAMHANVSDHVQNGSSLNDSGATISIPAVSGNNRKVYAIANYDKNHIAGLKNVTSEEDLKQMVVEVYGNPIYRELGMIKIGKIENQPIRLEGTTVTIPLTYVSAKITIKVVNKSSDLWVDSWAIGGLPLKTYLIERGINVDNPNYHDATDIFNGDDYFSSFEDISLPFDTSPDANGYGDAITPLEYVSTFYTLENRRGTKKMEDKSPIPNGWPHGNPSDFTGRKPYQEKAWEAPEHATYVRILGRHKRDVNPKAIIINHYLGADNIENYDVCRGTHYTYTITINGLRDIDVDTNIEQYDDPVPVRMAPDLLALDAHATFRMFSIQTGAVSSGQIDVEVLRSTNSVSGDWTDWAKVSLLPKRIHQVRAGADKPYIRRWQQEGSDGSYVRSKFIPHKSKRARGFVEPFVGFTFTGGENGDPDLTVQNPDYPPYGNAYPNNDDVLPYLWAARRMCNKITQLPTANTMPDIAEATMYVYVDEYVPDGNPYREAVLRITHTVGGQSSYQHWTIRQYAPITFLGLPGESGTVMLVERTEEYAHLIHTLLPINQQMTLGMQWGPYDISTSPSDGYLNTVKGVYQNVTESNYSWNTYLPKYGGMGGGSWQTSDGGKIEEPARGTMEGEPLYLIHTGVDAYNTLYNTTAARYCHEKNWDENGNGEIDPSETHWYLPSQRELQLFWTYREPLKLSPDYYWSSTGESTDKAYAVSMIESPAEPHQVHNGVQQPLVKATPVGANPPRVRCVRRISANGITALKPLVKNLIDGTFVIDCSNLPGDMYTSVSKIGIAQSDVGQLQKANSKVFKRFQIQKEQQAPVNYSAMHQNGGKCDAQKGWRLPTQREMLLIWSVKADLEGKGIGSFASGKYWTMTRGISSQYVVDGSDGGTAKYENVINGSSLYYRCIKELD